MEDTAEVPRALIAQSCSWKEQGGLARVICLQISHAQLEFAVSEIWLSKPRLCFQIRQSVLPPCIAAHFPCPWQVNEEEMTRTLMGLGWLWLLLLTFSSNVLPLTFISDDFLSSQNDHISLYGKFSCSKYRAVLLVPYGKDRKRFKWGFKMQIRMMGWNKVLVWKQHENLISGFSKLKVRNEMLTRIFQAGKKKKIRAIEGIAEIYKTMKNTERVQRIIFHRLF